MRLHCLVTSPSSFTPVNTSNRAALAGTLLLFAWCFVLLVRYSNAVSSTDGAILGALLIAATAVTFVIMAQSLASDMLMDAKKGKSEAPHDAGLEIGAVPAGEQARAEPEEEAGDGAASQSDQAQQRSSAQSGGSWADAGWLMCGEPADHSGSGGDTDGMDAAALARQIRELTKLLEQKDKAIAQLRDRQPVARSAADDDSDA